MQVTSPTSFSAITREKRCSTCKLTKEEAEFGFRSRATFSLNAECKLCAANRARLARIKKKGQGCN